MFVVDGVPERLEATRKILQCTAVDFSKEGAVEYIIKENGGKTVDRLVDVVGYQSTGGKGIDEMKEMPNVVLEQCTTITRPTRGIGVLGLYVPSDPGAPDDRAAKGIIAFSFGKLFEKVFSPSALTAHSQLFALFRC